MNCQCLLHVEICCIVCKLTATKVTVCIVQCSAVNVVYNNVVQQMCVSVEQKNTEKTLVSSSVPYGPFTVE